MKLTAMVCPACGAKLEAEEGRKFIFCSSCGVKVNIENENERVIRYVDEAKIRELELEEKKRQEAQEKEEALRRETEKKRVDLKAKIKKRYLVCYAVIALGVVLMLAGYGALLPGLLLIIFGIVGRVLLDDHFGAEMAKMEGRVRCPEYDEKATASEVKAIFENAGFKNVQLFNMKDVILGVFTKEDRVESVTIGGKEPHPRMWYDPNIVVTIRHHGR